MPIYEYKCEKCGEVFEAMQRMSDPPLKKHDTCGSKKVKRLISQTSFQLKGGGWYVTDYKKSSDKSSEKKEEKSEKKEDKPAEKKEDKPLKDKKKDAA